MKTLKFNNVYVLSSACVGNKFEIDGPLRGEFDGFYEEFYCGEKSYEAGEIRMLRDSFNYAIDKKNIKIEDIDLAIGGDLINQLGISHYFMKNISAIILSLALSLSLVACGNNVAGESESAEEAHSSGSDAISSVDSSEVESSEGLQNSETNSDPAEIVVDWDAISTLEDVDKAYNDTYYAREAGENYRGLDLKEITLDTVIENAIAAVALANTSTDGNMTTKIDAIGKMVTLDDLSNNTSQDVMEEVAKYIIELWESDSIVVANEDEMLKNLYITRYLDKRLDNHPNLKTIDDMIFDMYQVIKDTLREDTASANINIEQVNDNIEFSKKQLDMV